MKNFYFFKISNFILFPFYLFLFFVTNISAQTSDKDKNNTTFHAEQGLFTLKSDSTSKDISNEIISMRDEYSKTYCNSDGLYTKQTSDFPMHYRETDGAWYTYDKALTVSGDGVFRINKTDVPVSYDSKNGLVTMGYNKSGSVLRFGQKTSYKVTDSQGIVLEETALRDLSSFR